MRGLETPGGLSSAGLQPPRAPAALRSAFPTPRAPGRLFQLRTGDSLHLFASSAFLSSTFSHFQTRHVCSHLSTRFFGAAGTALRPLSRPRVPCGRVTAFSPARSQRRVRPVPRVLLLRRPHRQPTQAAPAPPFLSVRPHLPFLASPLRLQLPALPRPTRHLWPLSPASQPQGQTWLRGSRAPAAQASHRPWAEASVSASLRSRSRRAEASSRRREVACIARWQASLASLASLPPLGSAACFLLHSVL